MKYFVLIILFPLTLFCGEDFYVQLQKLTDGRENIPERNQLELEKIDNGDIRNGVGGIKFGMTMQQVIDIYGRPRSISFQMEDVIQIGIYQSYFIFKGNKLRSMNFHQIDLPHLKVMNGLVVMGPGLGSAIKGKFPNATYTIFYKVRHGVEFDDGYKIFVQENNS